MSRQEIHDLQDSTLGELREIVRLSQALPDEAIVRVRVRLGANTEGGLLKRVHLSERRVNLTEPRPN